MDRYDTLLLACGSSESRARTRRALGDAYNLLEAANASQMLLLLERDTNGIAAVLLDVTRPETLDGEQILGERGTALLSRIPVIALTDNDEPRILDDYFELGAADVIPLDYDPYAMVRRIDTIVQLHLHRQNLEQMVRTQARQIRQSNEAMVDALSAIIEYRSVESGQHILRLRRFTRILLEQVARTCPEYALTEDVISIVSSAAALHDVGKIGISDAILIKPGPLTPEEREVMRTHTSIGCRILESMGGVADKEYLRYAHNICHYHHERWDGGGYPEGLAGENIPICAQVVGLADAYDALTTKRVYKDPVDRRKAAEMIMAGECGRFSPRLLECFRQCLPRMEAVSRDYADGLSPKSETFETALPVPEAAVLPAGGDRTGTAGKAPEAAGETEIPRELEELREKIRRYEIILAQTENVLFDWDLVADTISFSDTWQSIFGYSPISTEVCRHLETGAFFHPDDHPALMEGIRRIREGSDYQMLEARVVSRESRYLWCRFRASVIRDEHGSLRRIVGVIINIDAEKRASQALQDRAERDALTSLLNKEAGRRLAEDYLKQNGRGRGCALLIIDLDNFKTVNDRYGHLFGDSVLTRAAREIRKLFRTQDIVARIGGDEFLVLLQGTSGREPVENRCRRLLDVFRDCFQNIGISCSIGVALCPIHGSTYVELFQRADQALYRAKHLGRDTYVVWDGTETSLSLPVTAVNGHIDSDDL